MCYFIVDVYIDDDRGRGAYDEYIQRVKPIVESFGGRYLARAERVEALSEKRTPQRVVIVSFPDEEHCKQCFSSEEYQSICAMRTESVDARALIVMENKL